MCRLKSGAGRFSGCWGTMGRARARCLESCSGWLLRSAGRRSSAGIRCARIVRGRWRKRFLVQADRQVDISAYMRAWAARFKTPPSIRVNLDIEPYSFL